MAIFAARLELGNDFRNIAQIFFNRIIASDFSFSVDKNCSLMAVVFSLVIDLRL